MKNKKDMIIKYEHLINNKINKKNIYNLNYKHIHPTFTNHFTIGITIQPRQADFIGKQWIRSPYKSNSVPQLPQWCTPDTVHKCQTWPLLFPSLNHRYWWHSFCSWTLAQLSWNVKLMPKISASSHSFMSHK